MKKHHLLIATTLLTLPTLSQLTAQESIYQPYTTPILYNAFPAKKQNKQSQSLYLTLKQAGTDFSSWWRKRMAHLLILLCYTIILVPISGLLMWLGHITHLLSEKTFNYGIYFILSILSFFLIIDPILTEKASQAINKGKLSSKLKEALKESLIISLPITCILILFTRLVSVQSNNTSNFAHEFNKNITALRITGSLEQNTMPDFGHILKKKYHHTDITVGNNSLTIASTPKHVIASLKKIRYDIDEFLTKDENSSKYA